MYNVDCDGQRLAHIDRAFGIRFTGRTPTARDAPRRAAVCRGVLQSGPCRHSELRPYLSGPSYPKYPLVHFRENSELLRGKGQSIAGGGRPPCEPYPLRFVQMVRRADFVTPALRSSQSTGWT